jgi:hypothetical protein
VDAGVEGRVGDAAGLGALVAVLATTGVGAAAGAGEPAGTGAAAGGGAPARARSAPGADCPRPGAVSWPVSLRPVALCLPRGRLPGGTGRGDIPSGCTVSGSTWAGASSGRQGPPGSLTGDSPAPDPDRPARDCAGSGPGQPVPPCLKEVTTCSGISKAGGNPAALTAPAADPVTSGSPGSGNADSGKPASDSPDSGNPEPLGPASGRAEPALARSAPA